MINLYLIDGNSYFYRAYHATKGLSSSKGLPTNAIYIFTNMIFKVLREKKPDAIAIAFDTPEPTERRIIYENYKAQRPETPDDLLIQIPHIKEIIRAFGITTFEIPGFEADDIICTIAMKAASEGAKVFILSGDKDMMQTVCENIKIYDPMKDLLIDEEQVIKRFGVTPIRIPEIMALSGDAVDNIPGVKGIGEKTAKEILKEAGSLDALIDNPELISSKRLQNLIKDNLETIKMCRTLTTLNCKLPLECSLQDLSLKEPDWNELLLIFTKFEFTSLIKLIPSAGHSPRGSYYALTDKDELLRFLGRS
jgi:DNA polymerase-1